MLPSNDTTEAGSKDRIVQGVVQSQPVSKRQSTRRKHRQKHGNFTTKLESGKSYLGSGMRSNVSHEGDGRRRKFDSSPAKRIKGVSEVRLEENSSGDITMQTMGLQKNVTSQSICDLEHTTGVLNELLVSERDTSADNMDLSDVQTATRQPQHSPKPRDRQDIAIRLIVWQGLLDLLTICRIASVSKLWRDISYSRLSIGQRLDMRPYKFRIGTLSMSSLVDHRLQLRGSHSLTSLNLTGCCQVSEEVILKILTISTHLHDLRLGECMHHRRNYGVGRRSIPTSTAVYDCHCVCVTDELLVDMSKIVPLCERLTRISLSSPRKPTKINEFAIRALVLNCPRLRVLEVTRANLTDCILLDYVRSGRPMLLEGISMSQSEPLNLETVIELVERCPKLESYPPGPAGCLKVHNNPQGLDNLKKVVPHLTKADFFRLWGILH
eukprot:110567_1